MRIHSGQAYRALSTLKAPFLLEDASLGDTCPGATFDAVLDPATGERIAFVPRQKADDIGVIVDRAQRGFATWHGQLAVDRGSRLLEWARLLREHAEDMAVVCTAEQGKPVRQARDEVSYAAGFLEWFAAEGQRAQGQTQPTHKPGSLVTITMHPVGVVAAITPWNFPIAMITRKVGAALAAGCSVIVKPAPETPLSALALLRLARAAGVPEDVFQVINGPAAPLSQALMAHPNVRALSFTGSTEVGKTLLTHAAATVKRVSMELGGHAPFIIFDDAPLTETVSHAIEAKFATSGQDCLAANRIYVQRALYEPFVRAFGERTAALKVGHGLDPQSDVGPMTRRSVVRKAQLHIADALSKGARLVAGCAQDDEESRFVIPTVLADVHDGMLIATEETFAPVAGILPFDDEDEVIVRSNATEMGLAAYVHTRDLSRALRVSQRLDYGMVAVNTASFTGASVPFGGVKQSGLGREGGQHGLYEFLEPKVICVGGVMA
jgi:aspartate-semialdehyde dehydrogenase